jgi:hypothetical protein
MTPLPRDGRPSWLAWPKKLALKGAGVRVRISAIWSRGSDGLSMALTGVATRQTKLGRRCRRRRPQCADADERLPPIDPHSASDRTGFRLGGQLTRCRVGRTYQVGGGLCEPSYGRISFPRHRVTSVISVVPLGVFGEPPRRHVVDHALTQRYYAIMVTLAYFLVSAISPGFIVTSWSGPWRGSAGLLFRNFPIT